MDKTNILVENNIKLVYAVIRTYTNYNLTDSNKVIDEEDLFQVGCMGLFKAAQDYDEARGVKFSTFAWVYIRNAIIKEISKFKKDIPFFYSEQIDAVESEECYTLDTEWIEKDSLNKTLKSTIKGCKAEDTYTLGIIILNKIADGKKLHEIARELKITDRKIKVILASSRRFFRSQKDNIMEEIA